jgi:hypothetical protein
MVRKSWRAIKDQSRPGRLAPHCALERTRKAHKMVAVDRVRDALLAGIVEEGLKEVELCLKRRANQASPVVLDDTEQDRVQDLDRRVLVHVEFCKPCDTRLNCLNHADAPRAP